MKEALKIQEILRIANCLNGEDFKIIFGEDYEHYLKRFEEKELFKFICYLDSWNMERFYARCMEKFKNQNSKPAVNHKTGITRKDVHRIGGFDYELIKKFTVQEEGAGIQYMEWESHFVVIEGVEIEFETEELASQAYYNFIDCLPEDE